MLARILVLNFFTATVLSISAVLGGIIAGLQSSHKSYWDLIWVLY